MLRKRQRAFIGGGRMGRGLAKNLLKQGHAKALRYFTHVAEKLQVGVLVGEAGHQIFAHRSEPGVATR